jgi:hypothetical protein
MRRLQAEMAATREKHILYGVPKNHVVRPMELRRAIAKRVLRRTRHSRLTSKSCKFEPGINLFDYHIVQELGREKRKFVEYVPAHFLTHQHDITR